MDTVDLKAFESNVKQRVPNFTLAWKDRSPLNIAIGKFLSPFNSGYMTDFVTTIYPTVYYPTQQEYEQDPMNSFLVLAHESVHLTDARDNWSWFTISYLAPQVMFVGFFAAALMMLPFTVEGFLAFLLLAVLSVFPFPSPGRTHWEKRGYSMTIAANYWLTGVIDPELTKECKKNFLNGNYYWMSWSSKDIDSWASEAEADAVSGKVLEHGEAFVAAHEFLKSRNLLVQK